MVLFGIVLVVEECFSLIQNAVVYWLRYVKSQSLRGAKWMQPLQPSQKTPGIFLPL